MGISNGFRAISAHSTFLSFDFLQIFICMHFRLKNNNNVKLFCVVLCIDKQYFYAHNACKNFIRENA